MNILSGKENIDERHSSRMERDSLPKTEQNKENGGKNAATEDRDNTNNNKKGDPPQKNEQYKAESKTSAKKAKGVSFI